MSLLITLLNDSNLYILLFDFIMDIAYFYMVYEIAFLKLSKTLIVIIRSAINFATFSITSFVDSA